ncbi:MAG TPA: zinc-binding dehydrogenase, partial [Caulobacteraceae bacterium]|nr:zinc-binding dehydrogenase [Caulobacteraceae bacterium]
HSHGLQLRTEISADGQLKLNLVDVPTPQPGPDEIVVQVEATPINPSDIGLLFGAADMGQAKGSTDAAGPVITAPVPERLMPMMAPRVGQSMPAGNEGAGTVVAAGSSPAAQTLIGKKVALLGGSMYAQYRLARVQDALPLPTDASAADGASCFVNPLTALCMVECMRLEGHSAIVHTAAASNLGQMLVKICLADGVPLVNIVRSAEQQKILREIGAKYVVDSTSPNFIAELTDAVKETGATIAFDAIGGGRLASQILGAMEVAAVAKMTAYSRYGSSTFKQVYIYGSLDNSPTELVRSFGLTWAVSGFLLTNFIGRLGVEGSQRLRARVVAELTTTFASHYTQEISLKDMLDPQILAAYNRRATGEKYLVNPSL